MKIRVGELGDVAVVLLDGWNEQDRGTELRGEWHAIGHSEDGSLTGLDLVVTLDNGQKLGLCLCPRISETQTTALPRLALASDGA